MKRTMRSLNHWEGPAWAKTLSRCGHARQLRPIAYKPIFCIRFGRWNQWPDVRGFIISVCLELVLFATYHHYFIRPVVIPAQCEGVGGALVGVAVRHRLEKSCTTLVYFTRATRSGGEGGGGGWDMCTPRVTSSMWQSGAWGYIYDRSRTPLAPHTYTHLWVGMTIYIGLPILVAERALWTSPPPLHTVMRTFHAPPPLVGRDTSMPPPLHDLFCGVISNLPVSPTFLCPNTLSASNKTLLVS